MAVPWPAFSDPLAISRGDLAAVCKRPSGMQIGRGAEVHSNASATRLRVPMRGRRKPSAAATGEACHGAGRLAAAARGDSVRRLIGQYWMA